MNPLVDMCEQLTKACYAQDPELLATKYHNPHFVSLARWLGREYRLERATTSDPRDGKLCICFGAGIDSYCALVHALEQDFDVVLFWMDYGQPYAEHEHCVFHQVRNKVGAFHQDLKRFPAFERLEWASSTAHLIPRDIKGMDWENYIVPARNLFLAARGSQYGEEVWIVANKRSDESVGAKDKTSRFYNQSSVLFSEFYGTRIRVRSPFLGQSKLEMVQEYLKKGGSLDALKGTFSCYSPVEGDHCGICYACFKRYKLFQDLNVEYNFHYPPHDGPNWHNYILQEQKKRGTDQNKEADV